MRRPLICLTCAALVGACAADDAPPPHDDPPPLDVDDATSTPPPELEAATATIRVLYESLVTAPDLGTTITLRGEGSLATETPCVRLDAQTCEAQVTAFPAGERELAFRPYLGGVPARGARYLVGRGETVEVAPHFVRTQSSLSTFSGAFHFATLDGVEPNNTRRIWALYPASYGENIAKRYPVVYMHDGRNLFDAALSITGVEWQVDETADRAWEETGEFAEVIVIGVDQFVTVDGVLGNYRQGEYNPTPDQGLLNRPPSGKLYAQAIATELKPRIDSALRTLPDRAHTATLGSSLGASISAWLAHAHAGVFGRAGLMSPASGIDNAWIIDQLLSGRTDTTTRLAALYIDAGVAEGTAVAAQYIDAYHALGYVDGETMTSYFEVNGYHDETAWARRLPVALAALFPDRRVP
jgi:predicted alpha/beta superfamily hydrolase